MNPLILKFFKKWKLFKRFSSLNNLVKTSFLIACVSILSIELWLKHVPAPFYQLVPLGDIYLKLCYSIAGSTIFYFINVHWPKQQDKMRFHMYLKGRIGWIYGDVSYLVQFVLGVPITNTGEDIVFDSEAIKQACENLDSHSMLSDIESALVTWDTYKKKFYESVARRVDEILAFPETIDKPTILKLARIRELARLIGTSQEGKRPNSGWIISILTLSFELGIKIVPKRNYDF